MILNNNISLRTISFSAIYLFLMLFLSNDLHEISASILMTLSLFLGLTFIYRWDKGFFYFRNIFFVLYFFIGIYLRYLYVFINQDVWCDFLVVSRIPALGINHLKTSYVVFMFVLLYIFGLNTATPKFYPCDKISYEFLNKPNYILMTIYIVMVLLFIVYKANNIRLAVSSEFGIYDNMFKTIGVFVKFIAYMYLILFFETKKRIHLFIAAICIIPIILFSLMSLYKGTILWELLTLFVIKNQYQKINQFRYFVIIILVFSIVFPTISIMRTNIVNENNQTTLGKNGISDFYKKNNPITYLSNRFSYYDEAYYVVSREPDFLKHFRDEAGSFSTILPAAFIPRFLWIDKPIISPGNAITYKLCKLPDYIYTNLSVGLIGESIAYGGYTLCFCIAFFLGVIQKAIDQLIETHFSELSFAFHIMVGRCLLGLSEGIIISAIISLCTIVILRYILEKIFVIRSFS